MELKISSGFAKPNFGRGYRATQIMPKQITIAADEILVNEPFRKIVSKFQQAANEVVSDLNSRVGKKGQFLNWFDLPKQQLDRIDDIFKTVSEFKKINEGEERPLVVIGIGGSKHTTENVLNMFGLGNKGKVHFYSDIDSISHANFVEELGGDISKANFLVVSKSGTTFEPQDAYLKMMEEVKKQHVANGLSQFTAQIKAKQQFMAATDANPATSALRRSAMEKGHIADLYIHDDVGGRFSALDDPTLATLIYAGASKADITKMLKAAADVTPELLSNNLKKNQALRNAIFSIDSEKAGFGFTVQQFFGKLFESGGENWLKQIYLESLKDLRLAVGKAPDSMHYAAEGHFNPANMFHAVLTKMGMGAKDKNYNEYLRGITKTYANTRPTVVEKLQTQGNRIAPEAIGEYLQTKHAEIIYTGRLREYVGLAPKTNLTADTALPEVLQPHVEVYKKALKGKLNPGTPYA